MSAGLGGYRELRVPFLLDPYTPQAIPWVLRLLRGTSRPPDGLEHLALLGNYSGRRMLV